MRSAGAPTGHQDTGIYVDALPGEAPRADRVNEPPAVYRTESDELARNVTVRVALDPQPEAKGPLVVRPRSHHYNYFGDGRCGHAFLRHKFSDGGGVTVEQQVGSALFYRPLTLHRSEEMREPGHRRTLYMQYGPMGLRLPGQPDTYAALSPWPLPCPLRPVDTVLPAPAAARL